MQADEADSVLWMRVQALGISTVLAVTVLGRTATIHSFPLVEENGPACCVGSSRRHTQVSTTLDCGTAAAARALEARFRAAVARRPRRLLCLVNPHSGTGRSLALFRREVEPLLSLANVQATLVLTTHPGHAAQYTATLDASQYDAVFIVSGDGLLSEAYTGLQANPDAGAALLPLAAIPAGTGNGIAMSLAFLAGEECSVLGATLAALTCERPLALDAAVVRQPGSSHDLHSLLSLSWGLIADIDIESDSLRMLGPARFTVQALLRCALLRHFDGKFVYRPAPSTASPVGRPATQAEAALAGELGAEEKGVGETGGWLTVDGPFEGIWAMNLPWGAQDAMPAPGALPGDGCYDVVMFRDGDSLSIAAALLALENGGHVQHACVTIVKACEFVLVPGKPRRGDRAGLIVVDGELAAQRRPKSLKLPLSYSPLHVCVRQGAARMLARPPRDHPKSSL